MYRALRWMRVPALLVPALALVASCRTSNDPLTPDPAFTPYIPAFTAGHISARSPILVRIAEGQTWKDSSAAAIQELLALDPDAAGTVRWQDRNTLAFQPAERLQQERTYTITFHLGRLIEVPKELQDFRFSVTTYRQGLDVKVTDLQPLSTTDLTWQRVLLAVYTSDDATGQDLEGCFTAEQDGKDLPLAWEHEPNGNFHRLAVDSVRRAETPGTVTFHWNGSKIGSSDAGDLPFAVPALGDMRLISTETFSDGEQYASLLFSDPLDPAQDLTGLAMINGAENVRLAVNGNKLLLYPQDQLSGPQQGFVSAGLANVAHKTLGKDITVDLDFEELKPNVRVTAAGTILPSTDGLLFPFEAVNLKAVDVRVIRIYADNVAQFLQVNNMDGESELARVGRPVVRTTVPLAAKDRAAYRKWARYYLDLEKLIKAEPGAIYRVQLGFRQAYSTYNCPDAPTASDLTTAETPDEDEAMWDQPGRDYYYYGEYYDEGEYDYREREEPCSPSYFYDKRTVVSRNILASDLGLIAKRGNDGSLVVAVSDIRTTAPLSGVKLDVLDLQRRSMAQASTNGDGVATLPPSKHPPFLLVASKGAQRGYLKLDDGGALNVSEYDVGGESVDKGIKGFLYGERGVWRPGDSLFLTFILQNVGNKLPKDHPVTLELSDPQGRLDQRLVRTTSVDGTYSFACATDPAAPTGIWNARVAVGGTFFYKSLRIEAVKPNRLKVQLDLGKDRITAAEQRQVALQSNWLHGAPARDLQARVTVSLTRAGASFNGYDDFGFNDLRNDLNSEELTVFDGKLDANGHATFPFDLSLNDHAPAAVNANIVTRVFEAGGDASTDRSEVTYYPYTAYAGLHMPEPSHNWGAYVTDTTYDVLLASVDPNGKALPGHALNVQVVKLSYNWWWNGDMEGPNSYMNAPSSRLMQDEEVRTDAKGRAHFKLRVSKPDWGRFVVRVSDPASGHVAATEIYMDWYGYEGRSRRQGEKEAAMLRFNSDKEKYAVGDQCTITFPSPAEGRALVSLENGSHVLSTRWVDLTEKETRFSFPITAEMAPNIYAHVTLLQPHAMTAPREGSTGNDLPIRLYGVIPIHVEDKASHLTPVIAMANEVRTDVPFNVQVSETNGKAMTYTLALVDEGLLDLTRFRTPDPWSYFYAREALGVRTWDLYDQVIGAFGRPLERVLALGGSDQVDPSKAAKANRFKPVVRFVGPFKLAKGKKAQHQFTLSNYVGSVRVMVVANDGQHAYGNAEKTVPVRKPLMLLATLPRVVGPGETVDLPVTVFAMDAKVKNVSLKLTANELFTVEGPSTQALTFSTTGDQVAVFRVKVAERIGVGKVTLTAEGAGERATQRIELDVRQPNQPQTDVTEAVVEAGRSWEHTPVPLGVDGTNSAYLEISTIPPVDLGRRLQYLVDYPHGCVEQTTSKAFPQLFLASVVDVDARTAQAMKGNVEAGLRRLKSFQLPGGSFSYWPGQSDVSDWANVYVGHFLVEAERKGFVLPAGMKDSWLNDQRERARNWTTFNQNGWRIADAQLLQAYRLYVLALAGKADAGAMNRLRTHPDLAGTPRWMLAAAFALNNRKDVARELVNGLHPEVAPYMQTGWTYGSDLRDESVIAEALLLMDDKATAAGVIKRIAAHLSSGEWYSTQSTAWGLIAVSRLASADGLSKALSFNLALDGQKQDRFSQKSVVRVELPVPNGKHRVGLVNTGKGLLYVRAVRTGTPVAGEEHASGHGLVMDVRYTNMQGNALDPGSLEQGTDLIALVTVQNPGTAADYQELALTQVFPSGWEIRNSRMEGTESVQQNSWYQYQDIRDDRVMTYFDLGPQRTATYRVLLNAAYTGRFYLPPTQCSAMYDNTVNARNAGRWVQVVRPGGTTAKN